jgi:hypothetical protein
MPGWDGGQNMSEGSAGNGRCLDESAEAGERNRIGSPLPYKLCGAKKRNGQPCRGAAMPNGRCRLHGGLTPSGLASACYKHGRRSKWRAFLPNNLRQGYDAAMNDPDLLSLRKVISEQYGFLVDTHKQMQESQAPPWAEALKCFDAYKKVRRVKDETKIAEAWAALEEVMRGGQAAVRLAKLEHKALEIIDRIVSSTSAEHKREVDLRILTPVENMQALFSLMFDVLVRRVKPKDEQLFKEVNADFMALLPPPGK